MGRQFDQIAESFIEADIGIVTATPLSMSILFYPTVTAEDEYCLIQIGDKDTDDNYFRLSAEQFDGGPYLNVFANVRDSGDTNWAQATNDFRVNAWNHAGGSWTSATERYAICNGDFANVGINTTNITPTGINRTTIGRERDVTPDDNWIGWLAECGIWDVALTPAEFGLLASGIPPDQIRAGHLKGYYPLVRPGSLVLDMSGNGNHLNTFNNPGITEHPNLRSLPMRTGVVAIPPFKPEAVVLEHWR